MPYLTNTEIAARLLARFGITATVAAADADIATTELDQSGPFIGTKKDATQALAFPRSVNPDGTTNEATAPPDAILDAVALLAYQAASDEGPPVTSESVSGVSVTYAKPAVPLSTRRVQALVSPYLLRAGTRA